MSAPRSKQWWESRSDGSRQHWRPMRPIRETDWDAFHRDRWQREDTLDPVARLAGAARLRKRLAGLCAWVDARVQEAA